MARILLVDDDADILTLGRALLTQAGHDAFTAASAGEAMTILHAQPAEMPIDVVITDANMPERSGFELIRTIRDKYSASAALAIAMLTGRRERPDIERALDLGVHDYIVKPIDPMLFLSKIGDLVTRKGGSDPSAQSSFASVGISAKGKILSTPVEVISISEAGLIVHSPTACRVECRVDLQSEIFEKIGIAAPVLRVLSSTPTAGKYEVRIAFVGADERVLSRIRAWVHLQTAKRRAS